MVLTGVESIVAALAAVIRTRQPRYCVSNVPRPLIRPLLSDEEHTEACAAAAQSLHKLWITDPAAAGSAS